MKKITTAIILCLIFTQLSIAQKTTQATDPSIDGRYLVIESNETYFEEIDGNIECNDVYIYNITENESIKPEYIAVTSLANVIDFGIKTKSYEYENQRGYFLVMNKNNYKYTFVNVIEAMNIKYIIYNNTKITVNEYIKLLLNK